MKFAFAIAFLSVSLLHGLDPVHLWKARGLLAEERIDSLSKVYSKSKNQGTKFEIILETAFFPHKSKTTFSRIRMAGGDEFFLNLDFGKDGFLSVSYMYNLSGELIIPAVFHEIPKNWNLIFDSVNGRPQAILMNKKEETKTFSIGIRDPFETRYSGW